MNRPHEYSVAALLCGLFAAVGPLGCDGAASQPQPAGTQRKQEDQAKLFEELKTKREATLASLQKMPIADLLTQMDADAEQGREPFNSPAYREVTKNRKGQAGALVEAIRKQQKTSYLPLLAARRLDVESYQQLDAAMRAEALLAELQRCTSFNHWGLPHLYWEDAGQAVIELGEAVEPGLKRLLADKSPAPVWGSEEVAEYEAYKYRRCDYALAMLWAIRGDDVKKLPRSQEERDTLIQTLLAE